MPARESAAMKKALKLVRSGATPYAAAKSTGVTHSAMYVALRRHGMAESIKPRIPAPSPAPAPLPAKSEDAATSIVTA